MEKVNNKEGIPFRHYKDEYALLDPEETARRCAVEYDGQQGKFTIWFLGNTYSISFPDFAVHCEENRVGADELTKSLTAQILIMRYLNHGKYVPALGTFQTYRELPWGNVYETNFRGRCIMRFAFSFGSRVEALKKAMSRLNAEPVKAGDAAWDVEILKGVYVRYILWEGDDEFPPSAQILFSDNCSSAFSTEDLAYVGDITINTFKLLSQGD